MQYSIYGHHSCKVSSFAVCPQRPPLWPPHVPRPGVGSPTCSAGSSRQQLSQMVLWSWALFSSFQFPRWQIPPKTVNSFLHQKPKEISGGECPQLSFAGPSHGGTLRLCDLWILLHPEPAMYSCWKNSHAKQESSACSRASHSLNTISTQNTFP